MTAGPHSVQRAEMSCNICGAVGFSTSYTEKSHEKQRMDRDGLCFTCAFWELKSEKDNKTVIDGHVYGPGNNLPSEKKRFLGMGGRRFDIEYFDGRRITTFDLWTGGEIPERWREKIPDTARFLGGARSAKVSTHRGEITCHDPSDYSADPYPLPDGRLVDKKGNLIDG